MFKSHAFIQLDFNGGSVSGSVMNPTNMDFASATVLGSSNKLKITNTSNLPQPFLITGTYSANLNTTIANPQAELARVGFDFDVITNSNIKLGGFATSIGGNNTFTANAVAFNIIPLIIPAGGSETVFIQSNSSLAGSAGVPEPLTILGAGTAVGFGAFFKRELAKKKKDKTTD